MKLYVLPEPVLANGRFSLRKQLRQFRTNLERTTFNFRTVVPPVALVEDCHGTWGEAAENERDGPNEPFAVAGQPVAFDAGKEEETVSVC